jgi:hypothetical protein
MESYTPLSQQSTCSVPESSAEGHPSAPPPPPTPEPILLAPADEPLQPLDTRTLEEMLADLDPEVRSMLLNPPPYTEEEPLDWLTMAWSGPFPPCEQEGCSTDCMFCESVQASVNAALDSQSAPLVAGQA